MTCVNYITNKKRRQAAVEFLARPEDWLTPTLQNCPMGNRHTFRLPFCCGSNPLVGFKSWGMQHFNEKHRAKRCLSLNWRAQKDSNPQPSDP